MKKESDQKDFAVDKRKDPKDSLFNINPLEEFERTQETIAKYKKEQRKEERVKPDNWQSFC